MTPTSRNMTFKMIMLEVLCIVTLLLGCSATDLNDGSYWNRYKTFENLHHVSESAVYDRVHSGDSLHLDAMKDLLTSPNVARVLKELRQLSNASLSQVCLNDTTLMLESAVSKHKWAERMLDAAGKPPSSILDGNLYWLGGYDQCFNIKAKNVNDTRVNFNGRYCKVRVGTPEAKKPFQIGGALVVTYGICLPSTCSAEDVNILIDTMVHAVLSPFPSQNTTRVFTSECKTEIWHLELTPFAIGSLSVICVFVLIITMATIFDIVDHHKKQAIAQSRYVVNYTDGSTVENGETITASGETANGDVGRYRQLRDEDDKAVERFTKEPAQGRFHNIVISFSLYTNGAKLLSTAQGEGSLRAVHGIRFISMSWVILGHTFFFALSSDIVGNILPYYSLMLRRWTTQVILNATVSVDTFFVLSGTLLSYLFMKEMVKLGGPRKINWFMFYFHRYWRLTPPYMLIMMIYVPLYRYWSDGPQYIQGEFGIDKNCQYNWWTNLLYINNLVHSSKQCMGWAWYLANDMQFFIISPLVLLALYRHWILGSVAIMSLILTNFLSSGIINTQHHASATFVQMADVADFTYWKPWCRIGPYALGLGLGYILHVTKCKVRIHWAVNLLGWSIATVLSLLVIYGLYDNYNGQPISQDVASLYNATARSAWALAVCWVIFACVTGYGGFVNMLLSWKGFIPLSRLTYCAYLIHPVIMDTYYRSLRTPYIATDTVLIYSFFGNLVAAYAIAFVVSLMFESPMIGLEKALFRK